MSKVTIINTPKGILRLYPTDWTYRSGSVQVFGFPVVTWFGGDPDPDEAEVIHDALWERERYEDCLALVRLFDPLIDLRLEDMQVTYRDYLMA